MASTSFKTPTHANRNRPAPVRTGANAHCRTPVAAAVLSACGARLAFAGVASCVLGALAPAAWAADCSWSSASSGSWTGSEFWSACGTGFPNASADTATINATGPDYTVTLDSDITVDTLTLNSSNATLRHVAGALSLNLLSIQQGIYELNGGSLVGGTVQQNGSFGLSFGGFSGNTLDGVTVRGDLNIGNPFTQSTLLIRNGLTVLSEDGSSPGVVNVGSSGFAGSFLGFAGSQTFDNGTIKLGSATTGGAVLTVEGDGSNLVLGPNAVVEGAGTISTQFFIGGTGTLTNQGVIRSNLAGQSLSINSGILRNEGVLEVSENSLMTLIGSITTDNLGTFKNAGVLSLNGTLDNTAATLGFTSTSGSLQLSSGYLLGGTVQQAGSNGLTFDGSSGNTLDGVTVRGDLNIGNPFTQSTLLIRNGLTVLSEDGSSPGVVNVGSSGFAGSFLGFAGSQIFDNGTIKLGSATTGGAVLTVEGDGSNLVLGSNAVVEGAGTISTQFFIGGTGTLTNQGLIRSNVPGQGLHLGITPTNLSGGTLSGGAWEAAAGATLTLFSQSGETIEINAATMTLDGRDAVIRVQDSLFGTVVNLESSLRRISSAGTLNILGDRDYVSTLAFDNAGVIRLGGGAFDTTSLQNRATGVVTGFGNVVPRVDNAGTVRAEGGTLNMTAGIGGANGRAASEAGATLAIGTDSETRFLDNQGAIALGAANIVVGKDYTNANFGVGNAFDRRANVTGAGQILSAGNVSQRLAGDVSSGATAAPTMEFGNIHVGDVVTRNYQVANAGVSGPDLRGALQTSVNGGNLTDSRLSGAGVTASNFGPVGVGSSTGNLGVTFTGSAAGALSGQQIAIVNNFDDIAEQVLSFSGAVYRYASAAPIAPVEFGNVHVGDIVSRSLTVTNNAVNDGFSEKLNATFGPVSDSRILTAGSISKLAAGATNSTALTIGLDTSTAGSVTGFATVNFVSDGAGSSGLGLSNLPSQNVGVRTNVAVYRYAEALIANTQPLDFGAFRVGDAASSIDLAIRNNVADDGFSEKLNASAGTADAGFTATGSFNLLSAGATNTGGLKVAVDTSTAGVKTGAARVNLASDGSGTSNLGTTTRAQQSVNLKAKVYGKAVADVQTLSIDFGIVHVGESVAARAIAVQNDATGALSDTLRGSISAVPAGFTASGSLGADGINAGATSSALQIGLNTLTAGVFNGNASLSFSSHNPDMTDLSLSPQQVGLTAQVNNFANPVFTKAGGAGTFAANGTALLYDFGTLAAGAAGVTGTLSLTNLVSGPADELGASFSVGLGPFALTGFDDFSGLAAGAARSLAVSFDPLTAGLFEQTVRVDLYGTNASGFLGGLGAVNVTFRAEVAPVPLPGAVWLMGTGLAVLLSRSRRTAAARV